VRRLNPPLADRLSARRGTYRILYRVDDSQQPSRSWTSRIDATSTAR